VAREAAKLESESGGSSQWQILKTSRVQGIGGTTGKALALSLIGGALYGVIKLVSRVTE
jgi:hypothetical protein